MKESANIKLANLTDEQKAAIQEKDTTRKRLKRASERLTLKQIKSRRAADAARQLGIEQKSILRMPYLSRWALRPSKFKVKV